MQHGQPVSSYYEVLRDEIPTILLEKLRQSQRFIYEEAYGRAFMDIFPEPEARDLIGHVRRALFETQLAKIAAECGLPCEVHTNKKRTEHHRVVRIGRLDLTAACVRSRKQKPRFAHYRTQASISSLFAFPTFDFLPKPESYNKDRLYIVVIHGPDPRAINRHGFVCIGIPDKNWRQWLELVSVDELLEAQKLRTEVAAKERVVDLATPKPKKAKEEGGK